MVILLSTVSAKHHRAVSVVVLGLAGFIDPLRPEVRDAVAVSRQAGVKVILIIGNHPATALAIEQWLILRHGSGDYGRHGNLQAGVPRRGHRIIQFVKSG